jgi:predicted ArsR family transcriptional regulator
MDPALFTATVTSLTHSFGDDTRRGLYLFLREHPGATVAELAQHTGVHANVVRHHLERLMEGGHVTCVETRGSGVGRPARAYQVTAGTVSVEGSIRRDALLVALLERALEQLGTEAAESLAHDVGAQYGRAICAGLGSAGDSQRSIKEAMGQIATLLTAHGFNAHAESHDSQETIVSDNCPFGAAAQHHPVLCAVDRGLIAGMLEGFGAAPTNVTLESRARGDESCRVTA